MTQRRLRKGQMDRNWTVGEFVWIVLSPRGPTPLHQAYIYTASPPCSGGGGTKPLTLLEAVTVGRTDMKPVITGTEDPFSLL